MMGRVRRVTIIVGLCLSLGFHWLALQSVAWTTMLVKNARHVSLSEAVAETFDGKHPCHLCRVVAAGKKSEKKSEVVPAVAKIDLICTTRRWSCLPPFRPHVYAGLVVSFDQYIEQPPSPPPRSLPG